MLFTKAVVHFRERYDKNCLYGLPGCWKPADAPAEPAGLRWA